MPKIQQINKPLSLEDIDRRIEKLTEYPRMELEIMTVARLRELGAYLIPDARKLKKSEFIDALLEISEPVKKKLEHRRALETAAALKIIDENIAVLGEQDISFDLVREAYLRSRKPEDFSNDIATVLKGKLAADELKDSTVAKTKMKHLKIVLEKLNLELPEAKTWADAVYKNTTSHIALISHEVNKKSAAKVENYGTDETTTQLDGKKILDWATEVIDWAFNQETLIKGWHKVSVALSLTSGRRMDEIHGSCQFEVINANTIRAIGLSKKQFDDAVLDSPCLVDANKWFSVLYKLPENRRNQTNSNVNEIIRKSIEGTGIYSYLYNNYDFHMIATEDVIHKITKALLYSKGDKKPPTYKDCRDFYISYLIARDFPTSGYRSQLAFCKKVIGHEAKKQSQSYEKIIVNL